MFNLLPNWFIRWCWSLFTGYINQLSFKQYHSNESEVKDQPGTQKEQRKRTTKTYHQLRTFNIPEEAKNWIKEQKIWSLQKREPNINKGDSDVYRCNQVKKREQQCASLFWSLPTLTSIKVSSLGFLLMNTTTMLLMLELRRKVKQK